MIYLDNAATTFPKPECVYETVNTVGRTLAVNVGRGGYRAASQAMQIVDDTKQKLASLVGLVRSDSVVFTPSATIAANQIILGLQWNSYKNAYVSPFEHNAIARPLYKKCQENGIEIHILPFDSTTHTLNEDEMKEQFAENPPDYVFINHVSNVTGTVVPVEQIAKAAKKYSAVVVVDASQSIGLIPINLSTLKIDYLIFAGHKNLYASFGVGGFVCNSDYPLKSVLTGGTGADSLNLDISSEIPSGFEFASPNILAIASLNSSLDWLHTETIEKISEHKQKLMQQLIQGLDRPSITLYLPENLAMHTSVLSFNIQGYQANEVGVILNEDFDIAVRTGYHCAPFVHKFLDTENCMGTVRASIGYFNTEEDIHSLVNAVVDILED